ncbi:ABC transporter permease [Actinosynnema pretiosum subsp. pretiosum]|uniref:ABC transporter transmembrane protein n=2 Tax=Actinosynnema TaxID=40566 RepID=C6WKF8_ACTMD|nr:ABC transporter permease [Actinosynnema mirum]ACU40209.1 hypothetical protein Amir_6408 [Actinosynnema mirum DSM 43827]AXX33721.1 putative integral membrane protein [Actinosynnema pretiosum subsp. pretiosum]QUF02504.1 ABC transporter permease [Actinosynnema pretiosum subsp. pretiosum]
MTDVAERTVLPGRVTGARVAARQTLWTAIRFEWVKARSLRGTWVGLAVVVLVLVGFSALATSVSVGAVSTPEGAPGPGGPFAATSDPLAIALTGANLAVLVLGVLGGMAGAREFGSRMISNSVAAVPRRWQVVLAKAVVFTATSLPAALVGVFGAFWVGMAVLSGGDADVVALGDEGVLRSVLGMAGYVTAIGLLGLGLGVLLRSTAGSIGAVIGGVLVLPAMAGGLLPDDWTSVLRFLPSSAGASFTTVMAAGDTTLGAGAGAAVLVAWVVGVLVAAGVVFGRRDV